MGGNALKNCHTRRFAADEYFKLEVEVVDLMKAFALGKNEQVAAIKAYKGKPSFGDMDILFSTTDKVDVFVDFVRTTFRSKEVVVNSNVISFEYKECQIDLILTKPEDFESSQEYFNYNDLGNLLGRVAHFMGLKLGHDGLSYNWRIDTYQFKNVVLLKRFEDILPVLGYSYERYKEGFDTLEDMFKFVASSPYFNKDIYLLNNRNHKSRIRDAKRKTYMDFLDWLEQYEENWMQVNNKEYHKDKSRWLPYLFVKIEGFQDTYNSVNKEWQEATLYKQLFNGDLVREWTGFEGKELGEFMKYLKEKDALPKDFVLKNSHLVKHVVMDYFTTFKETWHTKEEKKQ